MRELAERSYFGLCLALGRWLRSARYSTVQIVDNGGERQVRKWRSFHAPLLVWLGGPLLRIMDTGVRVLPQREWFERERSIHDRLRNASVRIDADDVLVLPFLRGETLAAMLEDPTVEERVQTNAVTCAVRALAHLHRLGCTHGDAMAENVMIDLDTGAAHWFDFETVHDSSRSVTWRRADDLRALLASCMVRTIRDKRARTVRLIVEGYADERVSRLLVTSFTSVWRRALTFHLAQAGITLQCFRELGRLLR